MGGEKQDAEKDEENATQNINVKRKDLLGKEKSVQNAEENNLNFLNHSYYLETVGLNIHVI